MFRSGKSLLLLVAILCAVMVVPKVYSYTTKLNLSPPTTVLLVGQSFSLDLTVTNVVELNSWQITLAFDPRILNCTGVSIPVDSMFAGLPYFFPPPAIDNTLGRVRAFCALEGPGTNVSGSGKLATIGFKIRGIGVSALPFQRVMEKHAYGTYLLDSDGTVIPFDVNTAIVEAVGSGFTSNTYGVTLGSQTYYVVTRTNSTVADFIYSESPKEVRFNMSGAVSTKGACIVEIDKHLLNGTLIVLLSNVGLSTYSRDMNTLPENATHLFTYFNFTYNAATKNIKIRLTVTGDITGDRKVDIKDLAIESAAYGSVPGSSNWNPVADLNHDFKVDIKDLAVVSAHFGDWLP